MKKTTSRIVRQSQAISLPLASPARHARHALYLTIGLLLLIVVALWAGAARPTAAAISYQIKGSGVETKGDAQIPACDPNWQVESSPNFAEVGIPSFLAVDAVSTNDIWAVGSNANIGSGANETLTEHWNGSTWSVVPSPNVGTDDELSAVTVLSANDVWAVGNYWEGIGPVTLTEHWNGSTWSVVPSPNVGGANDNQLDGVAAVSANDVWAVGFCFPCSNSALVEHWNGSTWSVVPSPNVGTGSAGLHAVTAVSANDVWAVGFYSGGTLIEHWNGSAWSVVPSPNVSGYENRLTGVAAVGANDVWAVGFYSGNSDDGTLVEHWNGSAWSVVPSPNPAAYNRLISVSAVSANDVWAVGYYCVDNDCPPGAFQTLVEHWNGAVWSVVPSPNVGTAHHYLNGVVAVSGSDVWAVGEYNDLGPYGALALHWNGSAWSTVATPNTDISPSALNAVDAAVGGNDVWAVGEYFDQEAGKLQTLIEQRTGGQWSVLPSPNTGSGSNQLKGVAAFSPINAWAVGSYHNGTVFRNLMAFWNGSTWSGELPPNMGTSDNRLEGVEIVSASDIWAVGYYFNGSARRTLILHRNGSGWSVVSSPNTGSGNNTLSAITFVNANDIWAVGTYRSGTTDRTLALHWNGTSWSVVSSPNTGSGNNTLLSVTAVSANDVWAVGNYYHTTLGKNQTLIERWNGSTWSVVSSPNASPSHNFLTGVDKVSATDVWAVGRYFDVNTSKYQTLIERWNGAGWSVVPSPNMGTDQNYLNAVTVDSPTDVWAVGYNDVGAAMNHTLIERYNPCTGTPSPTVPPRQTDTPTGTPPPTQIPGGPTATSPPTETPLGATATPTQASIQFTDVAPGSTFYEFIMCMVSRGIINGYTSGCGTGNPCFRPGNNVTRGQLSKIVSNAAGFADPVGAQQYEDVPPGSAFFDFVWRLADQGYVSGYACGGSGEACMPPNNLPYFRPNSNATRGQISKIVSNAAGFTDPDGIQIFEDVLPGSTFFDFIQRLASRGVMSGYVCGGAGEPCNPPDNRPYFRPASLATRGQTSKIVANTFYPGCQTPSAR